METFQVYNLTEYTAFRELQLDFIRIKDQNQQLKLKINAVQNMYCDAVQQIQNFKNNDNRIHEHYKFQNKRIIEKVNELMSFTYQKIQKSNIQKDKMPMMNISVNDCSNKAYEQRIIDFHQIITNVFQEVSFLKDKKEQLSLKYEREKQKIKQITFNHKKSQAQYTKQLTFLNHQLQKLQDQNKELIAQVNILKRQNAQYKHKLLENQKTSDFRHEEITKQNIQDNDFALQLLHYEKELLERIFVKVLSSFNNQEISEILAQIYTSYEEVSDAHRQKLQIEFDLEDLERQYKREKNSRISQCLLIQLRKQIQQFRIELQKQKQVQNKKQSILQQNFLNLQIAQKQDKKIRNYTVDIQKKLRQLKSVSQTKRNSEDSMRNSMTQIRFRPSSNSDEIMKEVVKKDRENIQKILRQTRQGHLKNSIDF